VHAPHRSSPTLTQSLSVPALRSTPTVHSHHRPSPSCPFSTTPRHTLSVHTDHLHIQPAPHGPSPNKRLLLTSLSTTRSAPHRPHNNTICSSQTSLPLSAPHRRVVLRSLLLTKQKKKVMQFFRFVNNFEYFYITV
jgi:hypothetical protein